MKHKFSRVLGVGLSLMLLMSLLAFAAPVSAGTLKWGTEVIPSTTGNVLAPGTDILDLAVGGDETTIYAAGRAGPEFETWTDGGTGEWSATPEGFNGNYCFALDGPMIVKVPYGETLQTFADVTQITVATHTVWDIKWTIYDTDSLQLHAKVYLDTTLDGEVDTVLTGGFGATDPTRAIDEWIDAYMRVGTAWQIEGYADGEFSNDPTVGGVHYITSPSAGPALSTLLADEDAGATWAAATVVYLAYGYAVAPLAYVDDITVDGTIYTVEPNIGSIFKSTDAGATWSGVTAPVDANSVQLVAVAPDDEDLVAIVADGKEVYITTDGGTTWGDLGVPKEGDAGGVATAINDIAISTESAGKHYIAVAGEETGPIANVWYWDLGAAAAYWHETNDLTGFAATVDSTSSVAAAVEFSPNFPSDLVMAVVTFADAAIDYVYLELFSFSGVAKWNSDAGFDEYPATIVSDDEGITFELASISLDPEYLGSDDAMRISFVGLTADDLSGIYRMDDITVKALKTGATVDVHSIAFDGITVVAGRHTGNGVWYCLDPLATSPTVSGASSLKRPGGTEKVVVAWVDTDVVAGTSGDESAFAVSTNNGKAFNDISLIDTALTNITDVAVSPDGSTVYMATDDGGDLSLWRQAASWERVLSIQDKDDFIVRLAADDDDVVYVADKGTKAIYYTANGGTERWQARTSRYDIQDLAVEGDGDVAYVLVEADGKVSKSTNAGFTWGSAKSSKLSGGNMIVSLGEDELLAAGDDGYVAYSTDGGSTWTKLGKQVGNSSSDVTTIASGLGDGDYVYAGLGTTDKGIYRWQIGTSTSWSTIQEDTDHPVRGMALYEGVLYVSAASSSANVTGVFRTLGPTDAVSVSWSTANATRPFRVEPQGLRITGGSAKMWAIDTVAGALYSYTDTLALFGPELVGPAQGFVDKINPISGYAMDVAFTWTKPSAKVTAYDLWIAVDTGFKEVAKKISVSSTSSTVGQVVGHSADEKLDFMPDEVYYWKVRVSGPLKSPWSLYRSFTVEEAPVPVTTITVEPAPAPEITVTPAAPPQVTVTIPPAPTPVAPSPAIPAYLLWAIICIGAVLIIALIVLIVRTRRVV